MRCACFLIAAATLTRHVVQGVVEVVVSHYKEDLTWVNKYARPDVKFTVYSKEDGPELVPATSVNLYERMLPAGAQFKILPNVGRESHTYLEHIVQNYHGLPEWSVFMQGAQPGFGYQGNGTHSGHMNSGVDLHDYLHPFPDGQDSKFVMTAASHFPSGFQLNRRGFVIQGLEEHPVNTQTCPIQWTAWWYEPGHPHLQGQNQDEFQNFYHRFVAKDENMGQPMVIAFAQGAIFAVSRERILSRPREYYVELLNQVSSSKEPQAGYWIEASWYDIFHPESLQAKTQLCNFPDMEPEKQARVPFINIVNAMRNELEAPETARRLHKKEPRPAGMWMPSETDEEPLDEATLIEMSTANLISEAYVSTAYVTKLMSVPYSVPYSRLYSVAYAGKYEERGALPFIASQGPATLLLVAVACLSTFGALALIVAKVRRVRSGYVATLQMSAGDEQEPQESAAEPLNP